MAAVGNSFVTLIDLATRLQGSKVAPIIELLAEKNELLQHLPWVEGNDGTGHKTVVRTGLPAATWRKLYGGVQPTKSTTAQIRDACGLLEAYSRIDKALYDISQDKAGFRMSEDAAHIEGMNQAFMDTLTYGNTEVNPERFMGIMPRFAAKSGAANGDNVILGGGAGSDNASIIIAVLGGDGLSGIYPQGSQAGLMVDDRQQQTVYAADGQYEAMVTHFSWKPGITLKDWRQMVRIANIDSSDLTSDGATGAKLIDLIVQGLELIHNPNGGKLVIMANRNIKSFLRRQIANKSNVHLGLDEVAGKHVLSFDGVPVLRNDALLNTEATVA